MGWRKPFERRFNIAPWPNAQYFIAHHDQKFWFSWAEHADFDLWLRIYYRGDFIGQVTTLTLKDGGLELSDIIIFPKYRHLRGHGVGSGMMKLLIEEARRQNYKYIRGVAKPDKYTTQEDLKRFYEKHSFLYSEPKPGVHHILLTLKYEE